MIGMTFCASNGIVIPSAYANNAFQAFLSLRKIMQLILMHVSGGRLDRSPVSSCEACHNQHSLFIPT